MCDSNVCDPAVATGTIKMSWMERCRALYDECAAENWNEVIVLSCSDSSDGIETPYQASGRRTCLHVAVERQAPSGVIRAILDAHVGSRVRIASVRDKYDQTALHTAALAIEFGNGYDAAALRDETAKFEMLIENDPACVQALNGEGMTPLHCLVASYDDSAFEDGDDLNDIKVACARILLNASTTQSILSCTHSTKFTVLHSACCKSHLSPDIVKMILGRCPQAVFAKDVDDNTPLHIAARNDGDDNDCAKITLLLESLREQGHSRAAVFNNLGHTPLHVAIHYFSGERVIEMLLGSQPETSCAKANDEQAMTPLDLLQQVNARDLSGKFRELGIAPSSLPEEQRTGIYLELDVEDMCDRCNLLVETMLSVRHGEHNNLTEDDKNLWMTTNQKENNTTTDQECFYYAFIHNYLRLGLECPLDFTLILTHLYPNQAQMKDSRGDLPLHIALENGVQYAKKRNGHLSLDDTTVDSDDDSSSNIFIKALIDAYPKAAWIPNRNGTLPFHILVRYRGGESGWHHGAQCLLRAHPAALLYHDDVPSLLPVLLPFILSRVMEEEDNGLSALYEFVKEMHISLLEHT